MTDIAKEQKMVVSLPAIDPAIGRALWHLEEARGRLKETLAGLDEALLDWEPYPNGNSIGSLLYHIVAVEIDWLYCEVLEQEFSPEAVALLPHLMRNEQGQLFPVTAVSLSDHLQRLDAARQLLLDAYARLTLADFRRLRHLPDYDVTPEWVLFHLTQHETEHRGHIQEIIALRDHFAG